MKQVHSVVHREPAFKEPERRTKRKKRVFQKKVFVMTLMDVNHNTKLIRIAKPEGNYKYPLAMHIFVEIKVNGEVIKRPYTPIIEGQYHLDLVIKKYENGPVSTFMHSLDIGGVLKIIGPMDPPFKYKANKNRYIAMIVCGTGITPVIPIIRQRHSDTSDNTKFKIIFQNRSEEDILLKTMLEGWMKPDEIEIEYILSQPTEENYPLTGHIDDYLSTSLSLSDIDTRPSHFIICGTDGFVTLSQTILQSFEIETSQITVF